MVFWENWFGNKRLEWVRAETDEITDSFGVSNNRKGLAQRNAEIELVIELEILGPWENE